MRFTINGILPVCLVSELFSYPAHHSGEGFLNTRYLKILLDLYCNNLLIFFFIIFDTNSCIAG